MILNTVQQAQNFVLYALENDELLEGYAGQELADNIAPQVRLVFGDHTFSSDVLYNLIAEAIEIFDNSAW